MTKAAFSWLKYNRNISPAISHSFLKYTKKPHQGEIHFHEITYSVATELVQQFPHRPFKKIELPNLTLKFVKNTDSLM